MFWVIWAILTIFSLLIFMNFIIAEVSEAYMEYSAQLDGINAQERAALIDESEEIIPHCCRNKNHFPGCIIIRDKEE